MAENEFASVTPGELLKEELLASTKIAFTFSRLIWRITCATRLAEGAASPPTRAIPQVSFVPWADLKADTLREYAIGR